jgi:phosphate/sulfate permease
VGLPASSLHTLIGSIKGVVLGNSMMSPAHVTATKTEQTQRNVPGNIRAIFPTR